MFALDIVLVKLHTVISFPRKLKDGEKATVVMDRSPYGAQALELFADIFVPMGFIGVGQDMRGTGQSEGNFTIWHSDADDSKDLGDWLVQQPWSNGKIFTIGASADGLAAFRTPDENPDWLKAQYFIWSSAQGYDIIFPNGAYLTALADMWIRSTVPDQADDLLQVIAANEMRNDWWTALDLTGRYGEIKFPSAFWAGWYDIFLLGNLNAYNGYNFQSDASVQHQSKLVVDPLGHCQDAAKFFPQDLIAGRTALSFMQALELYGIHPMERNNIKNVTFYVMSSNDEAGLSIANHWTTLETFPTYRATKYYLHGDRSVSTVAPAKGETSPQFSDYLFDPANPVPTQGGNNLAIACGPLDQSTIDKRADVIVFQTEAVTDEAVYMTGPLFATLFVSTNAVDTDFMVRISDVYPSGEARLIQDNAVRMRWRNGGETPQFLSLDMNDVYETTFTLWNTSYVLAPGHAMRISITSSNYPRFDINRNNGILLKDRQSTDVNITATNRIHHSEQYPSHVTLPIVQARQLPKVHSIIKEVQTAYPSLDVERFNNGSYYIFLISFLFLKCEINYLQLVCLQNTLSVFARLLSLFKTGNNDPVMVQII